MMEGFFRTGLGFFGMVWPDSGLATASYLYELTVSWQDAECFAALPADSFTLFGMISSECIVSRSV